MDYIKRTFADSKENYEIRIVPLSITLAPPPSATVHVFLRITREQKHQFSTLKYQLEPGTAANKKKITF